MTYIGSLRARKPPIIFANIFKYYRGACSVPTYDIRWKFNFSNIIGGFLGFEEKRCLL